MKYIDKLHEESIIYEKRVEAIFSIIFWLVIFWIFKKWKLVKKWGNLVSEAINFLGEEFWMHHVVDGFTKMLKMLWYIKLSTKTAYAEEIDEDRE
jgi:hypothetical protein